MGSKLRRSGIDIIGDIPWGSHFCSFYQTERDLLDMLIPFIRAGLESNELCLWVVSDSLCEEEAKEVVNSTIPNFDCYQEKGQIEIVPYSGWCCRNDWIQVVENGISRGFCGMRVAGSTVWMEERAQVSFMEYERVINNMIDQVQMLALCAFALPYCMACDVIDMMSSHHFALFNREGKREIIETSQHRKAEQALRDSEEKFCAIGKLASGMAHEINNQMTVIQACLDLYERDNTFGLACSRIQQAVERTSKLNRQLMLYSRFEDVFDEQIL